jgi:hypothetical protein
MDDKSNNDKSLNKVNQNKNNNKNQSKELKDLDKFNSSHKKLTEPSNTKYSQTASDGYSSDLPLSGSGRISIYDNSGSAASKTFYAMSAMGPGGVGTNSFPSSTFSTVLQPSEAVELGNEFVPSPPGPIADIA